MQRRPWDFELSQVQAPVTVWHGAQDTRVPAKVGRWLVDHLPEATYVEWPEHGHFSWATSERVLDVVRALLPLG